MRAPNSPPAASPQPVRRVAWATVLRWTLSGVVLWYLSRKIVENWAMLDLGRFQLSPAHIVSSIVVAGVFYYAAFLTWRCLLAGRGHTTSRWGQPLAIWVVSYLAKYIPGKVWVIASRAAMGRALGIPAGIGAVLALEETGLLVGTGIALGIFALPLPDAAWVWPTKALVVAGLIVLLMIRHRVAHELFRALPLLRRIPALRALAEQPATGASAAVVWSIVFWSGQALGFGLFSRGLVGGQFAVDGRSMAAYVLAYSLGVVAVLAPAGLGVREALLVVLLKPSLGEADALLVSGAARLWATAVDVSVALLGLTGWRRSATAAIRSGTAGRKPS